MNTMQLACFLTVAETLNFARAAEQLHVTQPAVTQQIRSLEEELNFKLFHRTTRTVALTRAGLMFMSDARNVLDILARAKKRGEDVFEDPRIPFGIGCHAHFEVFQFAPVLARLRERFPKLRPMFRVIPFRHLYQHLAEEDVDVVVSFREGGLKKYASYRELAKLPPFAVVPADHPMAERETVAMAELREERLILSEPWKCPDGLAKIQSQIMGDKAAAEITLSDAAESAVTLVRAGYGVAVVPGIAPVRDPALHYLPITDAEPMSYGVYYKSLAGRPDLRAFLDLSREHFAAAHPCPVQL